MILELRGHINRRIECEENCIPQKGDIIVLGGWEYEVINRKFFSYNNKIEKIQLEIAKKLI